MRQNALSEAGTEPAVHPHYLRLLAALLERRGLDPAELLAGSGLKPTLLAQDEPVDLHSLQGLAQAAVQQSGSPWLGLDFGASVQALHHGPVGYAAMASGSLRQALEVAARFLALRAPVLRLRLRRGVGGTSLSIEELGDLGGARRFVLEAVAVMLERLMQAVSARDLSGIVHELPWPEPVWSRHYAAYLAGTLRFGARGLRLRLPDHLLDSPCLGADPDAFAQASAECERRLAQGASERDLLSRLRRHLWRCEGSYPSAADSAQRFGISLRSFYRSLAASGCSYRSLLDEARCERARRLLAETDEPVARIAERLGYADSSNFSRCFRRWYGKTPSAWRSAGK